MDLSRLTCVAGFGLVVDGFGRRYGNGDDVARPFGDADFLALLRVSPFHLRPFPAN